MQNSITKIKNKIKTLFLSGLFAILPIVLTIAVFTFTFRVLKNWLDPLYDITPKFLKALPLSEFIFVFFAILAIGAILKFFLLRSLLDWIESLFGKIPLVRQIYFGIKQLIYEFSPREEEAFQKIVLVEFPRKNIYSLGFLTGQCPIELHPKENAIYYNVFIPNTPNPTTGYYIIVAEEECTFTSLTRQEAMTIIISGGIIKPDRFKNK